MLAFAEGVSVCVRVCVCRGEGHLEMKAQRDSREARQRQQVVLGAPLCRVKEAERFSCQQINKCETGRGLSISDRLTQTEIKVKDVV